MSPSLSEYPSREDLRGVIQGTIIYLGLYFMILIPFQSFSKFYLLSQKKKEAKKNDSKERISFKAIKYYNSRDRLALRGDRAVGNFGEYAFVFLALLWIHAIFVDHTKSLTIALVYTFVRALYVVLFDSMLVLFATVPGYMVLSYLMFEVSRYYLFDALF